MRDGEYQYMNQVPYAKRPGRALAQRFPPHVMQLAQAHGLGLPQALHRNYVGWLYILAGVGLFLAVGLCNVVNVALYSGMPILNSDGSVVTRSVADILLQGWQANVIFLLLALAALIGGLWGTRYTAYQCSEGWMELSGQQMKKMMYWRSIEHAWVHINRSYMWNQGRRHATTTRRYFLQDQQGEVVETSYKEIWQRANYELARREFSFVGPQLLADFHAGHPVSFDAIRVDQQGVHIPGGHTFNQRGWLIPLPAIVRVRVRVGLTFICDPASRLPAVHTPAPSTVNLLLLFLQAISQGRILCEHQCT